ncbi:MAG: helix-loop-helix domain-containing protein [Flavobacteriaceae bacterium]|nr:helix-loop-helix domain-containing protein [Flavobacteriaceae bacterium]
MKITVLEDQIYFLQPKKEGFTPIVKFTQGARFTKHPMSMIVECTDGDFLLNYDGFKDIQTKFQELKLIIVLVTKEKVPDELSDCLVATPTLQEAIDYIQFDRMQKELFD